jgi:hypothetical protein
MSSNNIKCNTTLKAKNSVMIMLLLGVQDLALGIADLNTPEALATAERVAAGQVQSSNPVADSSDDSSDDDMESDDETRTIASKYRSKPNKVKIIEN